MATVSDGTGRYHEPSPPRLLTFLSFVYVLQVARSLANAVLGAGLLGEIAIGVIYGPVAKILPVEWEDTLLVVGYLGLVLIVFEGGLNIKPSLFISALPLSTVAALVGILGPLALTFALFHGFGYPTLHAFAAGSALASTSLGTTFYVLRAQSSPSLGGSTEGLAEPKVDLAETRIGVTLQAAALIDDVVALVLLAVITAVGESGGETSGLGWTIGRPIVASAAMAILAPPFGYIIVRPLFKRFLEERMERIGRNAELFLGVALLSAFLAIAYYAGTTMLLGAYLAGVFLHSLPSESSTVDFLRTYEHLVGPLQEHLFAPFFFASIGFSIPFLQMWTGRIVWRGVVYSVLMALGKVLVAGTILASDLVAPPPSSQALPAKGSNESATKEKRQGGVLARLRGARGGERSVGGIVVEMSSRAERNKSGHVHRCPLDEDEKAEKANEGHLSASSDRPSTTTVVSSHTPTTSTKAVPMPMPMPMSSSRLRSIMNDTLPAAGFLGVGLIARGEIGVLVLQVAVNSSPAADGSGSRVLGTEAYLVALWAVALCTIVGPIAMGWLCRRFGARIARGPWGGAATRTS